MSSATWSQSVTAEINKRMTMNMLIQGSAWQSCLTAHHLIKDELDELYASEDSVPNGMITSTHFYDRFSTAVLIGQWNSELAFFTGLSSHFWSRVGSGKTEFCNHPLLVKHGKMLAKQSKRKTLKRCWDKGVWGQPVLLSFQLVSLLNRCQKFEQSNMIVLERLAKKAISRVWGIEEETFIARLTASPAFGNIRVPKTKMGKRLKNLMVGWGGVQQLSDGSMAVVGRSKYWSLLIHELSKGAMELISLHGLNELEEDVYDVVMEEADQIEFEIWHMQSGLELYRRLLDLLPREMPIAESMMYVAQMPADLHEVFTMAIVDDPTRAFRIFCEYAEV